MSDERQPESTGEIIDTHLAGPEEDYAVDRLKVRVNESLGKRPLTVYLVLFAGAATLLLLLGVVWISSRSGDGQQELICTEIAPADARAAILGGQVARINILVDDEHPVESLTGIQLRYSDGTCRQTPQGADLRPELFSIIGAVALFNQYGEGGIEIHYQAQNIQPELLATSTNTPEPTLEPTTTPTAPDPTMTPIPPTSTPMPPSATPTLVPTSTVPVVPAAVGSPTHVSPTVSPTPV